MFKKFTAAVLAGVMALALLCPTIMVTAGASAALENLSSATDLSSDANTKAIASEDGLEIEVSAGSVAVAVPTLSLSITGKPALILNPYKIEYTAANLDGGTNFLANSSAKISDQVIGSDIKITNNTELPVVIGVKNLKAEGDNNAVLASKTLKDDTKTKTNSAYVVLAVASTLDAARGLIDKADDKTAYNGTVIVTGSPKTKLDLYPIPKVDASGDTDECHMTFTGYCTSTPSVSWTSADKIRPTFVLVAKMVSSDTKFS